MNRNVFYGWWIVAYCFAMYFVVLGFNATLALFQIPMAEGLGVERTAISVIPMIIGITVLVFSMIYGAISSRFGIRPLIIFGTAVVGVGYLIMSRTDSIYVMYACAVGIGMAYAFTTTIPLTAIISNWFIERRGMVIGIVFAASGVGGMVFNPLIGGLIDSMGWEMAIMIQGIIVLAIGMPAALLIVEKPEQRNLKALGQGEDHSSETEVHGLEASEVYGSISYWLTAVGVFIMGICIQTILYNAPAYFNEIGLTSLRISQIMGATFGVNALMKIVYGRINDRAGVITVLAIIIVTYFTGISALLMLPVAMVQWAFPVLCGSALVLLSVPLPLFIQRLFGEKSYSVVMGPIIAALALGTAVGPVIGSAVYDATSSYSPAFIICAAIMVVAVGLFAWADRAKHPSMAVAKEF